MRTRSLRDCAAAGATRAENFPFTFKGTQLSHLRAKSLIMCLQVLNLPAPPRSLTQTEISRCRANSERRNNAGTETVKILTSLADPRWTLPRCTIRLGETGSVIKYPCGILDQALPEAISLE